jgi:hypothetical protein
MAGNYAVTATLGLCANQCDGNNQSNSAEIQFIAGNVTERICFNN